MIAIIGLVYWKVKGSDSPATAMTAPPVVTTTAPLAEPPPPPPPIDEPTAAVDAGPTRVATTNYGPCQVAKCGGSINNALSSAVSARAGAARPCYERALRSQRDAARQTHGERSRRPFRATSAARRSRRMRCTRRKCRTASRGCFGRRSFRLPPEGAWTVNIPLNFTPREGK